MSFFSNLIYYFNGSDNKTEQYHTTSDDNDFSIVDKKYLISKEDLIKVDLKPVNNIIPNPSRNMPLMDKSYLKNSNKAQLDIIKNVKLKPTKRNEKPTYYEPKHPVLRELLHRKYRHKNL